MELIFVEVDGSTADEALSRIRGIITHETETATLTPNRTHVAIVSGNATITVDDLVFEGWDRDEITLGAAQ